MINQITTPNDYQTRFIYQNERWSVHNNPGKRFKLNQRTR